jgi:hypothetical protein
MAFRTRAATSISPCSSTGRHPVSRSGPRSAHELQELFPAQEVDLAVLNHADPLFLKQVLERCRLLAGSSRRFAELKIYGFKRYQDHRRYLALESRHVRRVLGGA